jgi:hypothetical protein
LTSSENNINTLEPQLNTETFKSVRMIGQQILEQNIMHWHQLTNPETLQVFSRQELAEKKGIRYNKLHEISWEKLTKTVTDSNKKLLPQFQKHSDRMDNFNCSNLMCQPERLVRDSNTIQYVFTDGSVKTKADKSKIAVSAAFFDDGHLSNKAFRTVGLQTIFNAEAQAAEYGLYTLPIGPTICI